MIGETRPNALKVVGEGGNAISRRAESLGLIVTELVMNALKHAFLEDKVEGRISVAYDVQGTNWKLSVDNNGVGKPDGVFAQAKVASARASSRRLHSIRRNGRDRNGSSFAPQSEGDPTKSRRLQRSPLIHLGDDICGSKKAVRRELSMLPSRILHIASNPTGAPRAFLDSTCGVAAQKCHPHKHANRSKVHCYDI
jgi:hypothetical protein